MGGIMMLLFGSIAGIGLKTDHGRPRRSVQPTQPVYRFGDAW